MPGGTGIQHVRQTTDISGYKAQRFSPDFIIFHAQVDRCIRRMIPDACDNFAVQINSQRLKIAHFAVRAFNEFFVYDFRIRKPFLNYGFNRWWKPQGAQADPHNVFG